MVTTEWLNVYCNDAVKTIQNILPWQGQPPQKAAEQLSVVGGRVFLVIDAIYKRGTTPWFFRGPGWVMYADDPMSLQHCGHRFFGGGSKLGMTNILGDFGECPHLPKALPLS